MKKDSPKDLTALDQKANETLEDILSNKKAALGDKQEVSSVREAVKQDFNITTKGEEYSLIKQMEAEAEARKKALQDPLPMPGAGQEQGTAPAAEGNR